MILVNDSRITKYTINLANLKHPSEIYKWFKTRQIRQYAYIFRHIGTVLKIGESAELPCASRINRDWGERVRRQAENIKGWSKTYESSSGKEIIQIIESYEETTGLPVIKDYVTIDIFELSRYPIPKSSSTEQMIMLLEAEMILRYKKIYKELPIGNIRDESKCIERSENLLTREQLFKW